MNRKTLLGLTTALAAFSAPQAGFAQDEPAASSGDDVLLVLGTRRQGRSIANSPVPIDVLGADDLLNIGLTDTNDILQTLVPAFNIARQPISDGATFIRPPQLRGLDSDKTLVLVNGKRRHRAALVLLGGFGSHGPDIATIPAIALKNVQILRDGSGAQYGSDAIAGVLNFELNDRSDGGSAFVRYGEFYEGDGENLTVAGNYGFSLGSRGFVNISGEYNTQQPTSRG
ncbi:MAG: TonB-dependent receptor plug domain-containing protein, partial [Pseudomonadota bacterium]